MLDFSVSPKRFTNDSLIIGGALSTSLAGFRAYALGSTGGVTSRKSTERLAYEAGRGHGHTSKFTLDTTHIQGNLSIKDTLNKGHFSKEDTVCSPNQICRAVY